MVNAVDIKVKVTETTKNDDLDAWNAFCITLSFNESLKYEKNEAETIINERATAHYLKKDAYDVEDDDKT